MSQFGHKLPSRDALQSFDAFLEEITFVRFLLQRPNQTWCIAVAVAKGTDVLVRCLDRLSDRSLYDSDDDDEFEDSPPGIVGSLLGALGPSLLRLLGVSHPNEEWLDRTGDAEWKEDLGQIEAGPRTYLHAERIRHAERDFKRMLAERENDTEMAEMVDENLRSLFDDMVYDRRWPGSPS